MPFQKVPYMSFGQALTGAVDNLGRQMKYRDAVEMSMAKQMQAQRALEQQMQQNKMKMDLDAERFEFDRQKHSDALGMSKAQLESLDAYRKGQLELKGGKAGDSMSIAERLFPGKSQAMVTHRAVARDFLEQGLTPFEAQKAAIDRIRERTPKIRRVDDGLGNITYMETPGTPIFKNAPLKKDLQQRSGELVRYEGSEPVNYPNPSQTVRDAVIEGATGIGAPFRSARNIISSLTGELISPDEAFDRARTTIDNAKNMLRAFQEGKFLTAAEKNMIERNVKALDVSITKGPKSMLAQLRSIDDFLKQKRDVAELEMTRSGILSPEERKRLAAGITNIDEFRKYLGMEEGEMEMSPQTQPKSNISKNYRKSQAKDAEFDAKIDELLKGLGLDE